MEKILWFIRCAIELIYPTVCGICGRPCQTELCKKCEIKLNNLATVKIDRYQKKNYQKHLYLFKYEGIIKEKLIQFKFQDKIYLYKTFVNFMIKNKKVCRFLKTYDIIIPVPIHYLRKVTRGYNQSAFIAREIAKKQNLVYCEDVLLKKRNNQPQSTKNREERQKDVIGVYTLKNAHKIKDQNVLLIDDIYTTGSTVNECCRVLRQAKVKKVDVLTIAKD